MRIKAVHLLTVALVAIAMVAPAALAGADDKAEVPQLQCDGDVATHVWPESAQVGQAFNEDGFAVVDLSGEPGPVVLAFAWWNAEEWASLGQNWGWALITGTSGDDKLCGTNGGVQIINGGGGNDVIAGEGFMTEYSEGPPADARENGFVEELNGQGGNDTIYVGMSPNDSGPQPWDDSRFFEVWCYYPGAEANGGPGDDTLYGDVCHDTLRGNSGNDYLDGSWGEDLLKGGPGNDELMTGPQGGPGNFSDDRSDHYGDVANGQGGDDMISGWTTPDDFEHPEPFDARFPPCAAPPKLVGSTDMDTIDAGECGSYIFGGDDDDTINGGPGYDNVMAGPGDDVVTGGGDHDVLRGALGDDTLSANGQADPNPLTPLVNEGDYDGDSLYGGPGNDTLNGDDLYDWISGNAGNDTVNGGAGADDIYGKAGNDTLNGGDEPATDARGATGDYIAGGPGDDVVNGGDGADVIKGFAGADTLNGGDAWDTIWGGTGADDIFGDDGNDSLWGNYPDPGNDDVSDFASDVVNGGADDDLLYGACGDLDTAVDAPEAGSNDSAYDFDILDGEFEFVRECPEV